MVTVDRCKDQTLKIYYYFTKNRNKYKVIEIKRTDLACKEMKDGIKVEDTHGVIEDTKFRIGTTEDEEKDDNKNITGDKIKISAKEELEKRRDKNKPDLSVIFGIIGGGGAVIFILLLGFAVCIHMKKRSARKERELAEARTDLNPIYGLYHRYLPRIK